MKKALLATLLLATVLTGCDAPEEGKLGNFVHHSQLEDFGYDQTLELYVHKETGCYYIIQFDGDEPESISPYIVHEKPYCERDVNEG